MKKCSFICFEGIDGSGKTSISQQFASYAESFGKKVFFLDKKNTRLIDDDFSRSQLDNIKASLWDYPVQEDLSKLGDYHWLTLLASWYSALYETCVKPKIDEGYTVVCDGWVYKYIARFVMKQNIPDSLVKDIFNFIPSPDLIFFIDINPDVAYSRKNEIRPSESGAYDGEHQSIKTGFLNYQTKVRDNLTSVLCGKVVYINNDRHDMQYDVVKLAFSQFSC